MTSTCEPSHSTDELRRSRRVPLSNGIAFLRLPSRSELPSLPCVVENVSLGGCRCVALLERISPSSAAVWREALEQIPEATLDLFSAPRIAFRAGATIRYAINTESTNPALGLQFHSLNVKENAMLTCALERLEAPENTEFLEAANRTQFAGKRVTRILAEMGSIPEGVVEEAEQIALTSRRPVAHYLLRRGLVSTHQFTQALALHAELPVTDLSGLELTDEMLSIFARVVLLQNGMVPLDRTGQVVRVAVAKPLSRSTIRSLEARFGVGLYIFLAPEEQVNALLRQIDPQPRQNPRSYQRRVANVPVEFTFTNGGDVTFTGQTLDVCEGGFGLECADDLSLCGVCIRFKLNTSAGVVEGLGSIRFVRKDNGHDRWIAGVEILELTEDNWQRLTEYCAANA